MLHFVLRCVKINTTSALLCYTLFVLICNDATIRNVQSNIKSIVLRFLILYCYNTLCFVMLRFILCSTSRCSFRFYVYVLFYDVRICCVTGVLNSTTCTLCYIMSSQISYRPTVLCHVMLHNVLNVWF